MKQEWFRADLEVVGLGLGLNGQELAYQEWGMGVGQLGLEGLPCPLLCSSQTVPSLAGPVPSSQSTPVPQLFGILTG